MFLLQETIQCTGKTVKAHKLKYENVSFKNTNLQNVVANIYYAVIWHGQNKILLSNYSKRESAAEENILALPRSDTIKQSRL